MEDPKITYEGIDASDRDDDWRRGLHMPGDRVRFDSDARVAGVDPHDVIDALGRDPLTIAKSIVRTEMIPDHIGGERRASFLEYEFEGKDGRHSAKQFMEEGGREHMSAVLLVKDDRMWAVPMVEDEILRDGVMVVDGPAREMVGFAGRDQDQLDPGGFPSMRDMVRDDGGASGEFYVQPRDGFESLGPVNLLNSPWSSGVSDREKDLANAAIDKALAKETCEREDPVGVLVDRMSHVSKVWRLERERVDFRSGQGVPVADLATGERLAREEAGRLVRGFDATDANVRMAAAIVATEGRETATGSLDARRLADGMLDAPTASGRSALRAGGLIAQASRIDRLQAGAAVSKGPAAIGLADLQAARPGAGRDR